MYYQPKVIYRTAEEERKDSIIRYIGSRVLNNNKNFLCALTGQTGSGKSWAAVSLCEKYAKMHNIHFDPDKHLITSLKELLILINSPEKDKICPPGTILLFDEPQVEANSRNWQAESNKALNTLTSTFRNQRLVVLFATPMMEFIDKQSRDLFHAEFKVLGYDKITKITRIKPRFIELKQKGGGFYYKRLVICYPSPEKSVYNVGKLAIWKLEKASDESLRIYEEKKKKFTEELNKRLLDNLLLKEKRAEGQNKIEDFKKVAALFDKYGEDYLSICNEMPHLSPFTVEKMIMLIKRKFKKVKSADKL